MDNLPSTPIIGTEFGNWLAGFVDGEGHFGLTVTKNGVRPVFAITLRADDRAIIDDIATRFGVGHIAEYAERGNRHAQVGYRCESWSNCLAIAPVFEQFPLRAKKRLDFEVWRSCLDAWDCGEPVSVLRDFADAIKYVRLF